jgi:signal transduction histidine kinase
MPLRNAKKQIIKWYAAAFDIEDRKRAEEAALEQRILERTRIARELHDTLLQSFHASLLHFQGVSEMLEPGDVKERLDRAIDLAARAVTEGRDAIQDLRSPPVEADLPASMRLLGETLAASGTSPHSPVFHFQATGLPLWLRPDIRGEVFRIGSEALHNAFRHARAQHIHVEIAYQSEGLRLLVRDDGKGIARTVLNRGGRKGHFGLSGMRERATLIGGKLKLRSDKDSGTTLEFSIPAICAYSLPDDSH